MNNNKVLEILIDAKDVLSDKDVWTKGAISRDKDGNALRDAFDNSAVSYCLFGSLYKTYKKGHPFNDVEDAGALLYDNIRAKTDFHGIPEFNDCKSTTHKEVIGILDYTIRKLLKETENDNGVCEA